MNWKEFVEDVKAGETFKFFGMGDLKDLLEDLKERKVRGILIDFEKCVITVIDTMEEPET
jgi:hypothetical protein